MESELGRGTSVRLFLPRAIDVRHVGRRSGRRRQCGKAILKGLGVLLVEDDDRVRRLAASMLAELDCRVIEAENGEQAVNILADCSNVDVLFTDCMMPGRLDGRSLADEARRLVPGMPILFTSGVLDRAGLPDEEPKLRFLAKPYTITQLSEALISLCQARAEIPGRD